MVTYLITWDTGILRISSVLQPLDWITSLQDSQGHLRFKWTMVSQCCQCYGWISKTLSEHLATCHWIPEQGRTGGSSSTVLGIPLQGLLKGLLGGTQAGPARIAQFSCLSTPRPSRDSKAREDTGAEGITQMTRVLDIWTSKLIKHNLMTGGLRKKL